MTTADTEFMQVYNKSGDQDIGTVEFKRFQLLPFEESAISSSMRSIVELGGFPDVKIPA